MKIENEKKLTSVFKELKDSMKDLTKARIAYSRAKSKETVSKCVSNVKDSITTASKNFGLKLEENAKKYEKTQSDINEIISEYQQSIDTYRDVYTQVSEDNELKITELAGKRDEIIAQIALAKDEKQQFIEENAPDLLAQVEPIRIEQEKLEEESIAAIKNGNYNEAKSYIEQCESLKAKADEIEKPFEDKLSVFDKKRADLRKEFVDCRTQLSEAKKLAMQLEDDFLTNCDKSLQTKEELLAKVENNKMFDKIKGFLSRSVLRKINSVQKFKKDYLDPTKENVKEFTKSVPQKTYDLKQRFHSGISNIIGKGKQTIEKVKDKSIEKFNNARDFTNDKIQDAREGINIATDFVVGKTSQAKDFVVDKARDLRDITDAKIQDAKEGISQVSDYVSGKIVQRIDDAYEFGKKVQSAARNCAIDQLESAASRFNQKAQELREKEEKINGNSIKTSNEQELS